MLHTGQHAPDFELSNAAGAPVKLSDYAGKKCVVLYFYPKDHTPGCTVEAKAFRDQYGTFAAAGAEVIGVSSDSLKSHQRFAKNLELPFLLVSDEGGAVRREYGVEKTLGLIPGRVTYVIDRDGIVRHVFSSQLEAARHVDEALAALEATPPPPSRP